MDAWNSKDGIDTRSKVQGHRTIHNCTRYTALPPDRFKGFWRCGPFVAPVPRRERLNKTKPAMRV